MYIVVIVFKLSRPPTDTEWPDLMKRKTMHFLDATPWRGVLYNICYPNFETERTDHIKLFPKTKWRTMSFGRNPRKPAASCRPPPP